MTMLKVKNRKGDKIFFRYDFGRTSGQRASTGIFIFTEPKTQVEKNHNKEAMGLLAVKQSQLTIESQATGSEYIPRHNFKDNFLDYYKQFVDDNKREGNRLYILKHSSPLLSAIYATKTPRYLPTLDWVLIYLVLLLQNARFFCQSVLLFRLRGYVSDSTILFEVISQTGDDPS